VRRRVPNVRLWVVGARPHRDLLQLAREDADIHVTGFVPDPRPYFERCQVSVAPLHLGAGIKVKVLESMLAGLPVVGTAIAAEGIGASATEGLFVENATEGFANRVADLLTSPARAAAIGRRARAYVEKSFAWAHSERMLEGVFLSPTVLPGRASARRSSG
jgi:glycosyltransferase involved in cell wall biosynthesis